MAISTRTLADASKLLTYLLIDTVQIFTVGEPVTVGFSVSRPLSPAGEPVLALVQVTTTGAPLESLGETSYAVKVARDTPLAAGQAVQVLTCEQDSSIVGKILLLDSVSQNGLALLRKATARDWSAVNQEGKEAL